MNEQRTILFSYAHPDDEQGVSGTMALYLREGAQVGLICATRGEMGEIAPGVDATPENLGAVREQEMRNAMAVLAMPNLWFLDYRDSGMAGTGPNQDSAAFINADTAEVVGKIVSIIRSFKPQVVVTFDPGGVYGHPDHVAIHRWTTAAFEAAGDANAFPNSGAPLRPTAFFYSAAPRSAFQRMGEFMRANNPDQAEREGFDLATMGTPDEEISNRVNVSEFFDLKQESLQQHASQMAPDNPFAKMPKELMIAWRGTEYYVLAEGTPLPTDADPGDLFAGL